MARTIDRQISELRQTIEVYMSAADRYGRASESCCLALAVEALDRCERLVRLALVTAPTEEVVWEQAQCQPVEL
jgi:hypothetical protein